MDSKRILFVEDDDSVRESIEEALRSLGHDVDSFSNAKACGKVLTQKTYDLLITDIFMPEMDGIEFIMKARDVKPDLKIIAISGQNLRFGGFLEAARKLGANATLEKPVTIDAIQKAVETVLGN